MLKELNGTLLAMTFQDNGEASPMHAVSPRALLKYIHSILPDSNLQAPPIVMRDIRKLTTQFSPTNVPCVVVRRLIIMLNFDPLRAIILPDRLIVLLADGADSILDKLSLSLSASEVDVVTDPITQTFPFRAVEAIMGFVIENLETDSKELWARGHDAMRRLEDRNSLVNLEAVENIRGLKNSLATHEARIILTKKAIVELLEEEEDMALMNIVQPNMPLPPKLVSPPGSAGYSTFNKPDGHEHFEILFEGSLQTVMTIQTRTELLRTEMVNSEQLHNTRINIQRNRLLSIEISLTVLTACVSMGSLVTGIYGMNLSNGHENTPGIFEAVAILTCSAVGISFLIFVCLLSKTLGFSCPFLLV